MTTRILREFAFQAGVYFEDAFSMNMYNLSVCMDVETDSIREQNIAMERIKYFLAESLESSIFVNQDEKKLIEKYTSCGFKVCTLPNDPYDQIVTIMLLVKLNAITEGRLIVTDITLGSQMSDEVNFMYDLDSSLGPFEELGWWVDPNPIISDLDKSTNKKDKIVKLFNPNTSAWGEIDLLWKEVGAAITSSEIIFTTEK
jgi:hypothetical protein